MTTPPAIVQPSVPTRAATQQVRNVASFAKQGASARPLVPTSQTVSRAMSSPSFMNTSKLDTPAKAIADTASKAANIATKIPSVASRVAGLASRVNPVVGAAMTGAAASQALGKLATGTETGRSIGKAIGRAVNPPVSTLPKSEPSAPAPTPKPSTVGIKSGDTMTSIAKANKTSVADLAKANPDIKDVNKISAGKSLNLPKTDYSPKPVDQADTIRQSGGEPNVAQPKVAPTPPASSERPTAPTPSPMQNPDQNRTKIVKESVQVGDYKYRIV